MSGYSECKKCKRPIPHRSTLCAHCLTEEIWGNLHPVSLGEELEQVMKEIDKKIGKK